MGVSKTTIWKQGKKIFWYILPLFLLPSESDEEINTLHARLWRYGIRNLFEKRLVFTRILHHRKVNNLMDLINCWAKLRQDERATSVISDST